MEIDMNDIIVTREMLIADRACDPAMEAFDEASPNGSATLQEIVEHQLCQPKWLGWLTVNASFLTADIGMELIQRSDNPGYYYADAAVWADWVTAETGPTLIQHSSCPKNYYGECAALSHWVTAETGPDMIAKSSAPKYYARRAIFYAKWMTPEIKAELIAKYGL